MSGPSLSVVLTPRAASSGLDSVLAALVPQVRAVRGEVVVVCGRGEPASAPAPVRWIPVWDANLLRLRSLAVRSARGAVIAIGEDHSVPTPGWCAAILRAHAEHPAAAAVAGCLVNATDRTVAGRANFLAFAAQYAPPMPSLPDNQPPPASTLSFKRDALAALDDAPGSLESEVIPRLFREGRITPDDRVVVEHHQDFGILWSVGNSFASARSSYGYARPRLEPAQRWEVVRWVLTRMPAVLWRDTRDARGKVQRLGRDLPAIAVIQAAAVAGGAVGTLAGPGRAPERVA